MRLNEFQKKIVQREVFPKELVGDSMKKILEGQAAQLLKQAAFLAHAAGSDLDTIAHCYIMEMESESAIATV